MKDIFISIRRTPYQSLSAFLVLFFTLFLSTAILFSISLLYGFLGYVETRPQVTVYFKTQITKDSVLKVRDTLIASGKILSIKYISKEDAFKIYKDLNKNNPLLLAMISSEIFPASLEIYAKKPAYLVEIADFLKKQVGVDEVNFQKIIIDRLLAITNIIRQASLVFFGFLIFITVIILSTIIHFKVALKKDEIELVRLLGASKFYIKKPFLLEAVIFGIISATFAFLIFIGILLLFLNPLLSSYLMNTGNLFINFGNYQTVIWPLNLRFLSMIYIIIALFGTFISVSASFLATQKYIR